VKVLQRLRNRIRTGVWYTDREVDELLQRVRDFAPGDAGWVTAPPCRRAPAGWWCSIPAPHDGPCAARVVGDLCGETYEGCSFAHCDSSLLHAPGECKYCDAYPLRQRQRVVTGVNFTGHDDPGKQPCPADASRPPGSASDHRRWAGNRPSFCEPGAHQ
jgi:hypothetical protein